MMGRLPARLRGRGPDRVVSKRPPGGGDKAMAETKQELEDEVARLRNRINELEKEQELNKKQGRKSSRSSESDRNITRRASNEGSGLIRGFTLAGVEAVRATGSVLSSFADTVSQRNRPEEKDSTGELTRDLPKDVYSGVVNAVDQVFDIPGKVIDRLHEGYKESK